MTFAGIERIYGAGAEHLCRAHVLVVGVGGVGSWTVEALARSGIGALTLADPDDICQSNINRQVQALHNTIGQRKIDVLAERVHQINPACCLNRYPYFVNERTMAALLDEPYDYVVDAIDGVMPKAGLIAGCRQRGLPMVTCGGSGGKRRPEWVQMADLSETCHDRLLAFVRKKLRHVFNFPADGPFGVPCVFSPEPVIVAAVDACAGEIAADNPLRAEAGARLTCDGRLGAVPFVTGTFGFYAAAHVVNALTVNPSAV